MTNSTLYNIIGNGYNATRKADDYISQRLFDLLSPTIDNLYLDIGCGTGNYTNKLSANGINFHGIDPSEQMLEQARSGNNNIKWSLGSAENIPLNDETFSGAIATLTLHHWKDLQVAFGELYRVLKPDSRLVLFTADPRQMEGYWLNHYFPMMMKHSIDQMPSLQHIEKSANAGGLKIETTENYFVQNDLQDHFLYVGKNNPRFYFYEYIRKGISSFASLANAEEVERGLIELEKDMLSGNFSSVRDGYQNDLGDYLFIVLQKN